jgi:hypothetical protein
MTTWSPAYGVKLEALRTSAIYLKIVASKIWYRFAIRFSLIGNALLFSLSLPYDRDYGRWWLWHGQCYAQRYFSKYVRIIRNIDWEARSPSMLIFYAQSCYFIDIAVSFLLISTLVCLYECCCESIGVDHCRQTMKKIYFLNLLLINCFYFLLMI